MGSAFVEIEASESPREDDISEEIKAKETKEVKQEEEGEALPPPRWARRYQDEIHQSLIDYLIKDLVFIVIEYFDFFDSLLAPFQQLAFETCCLERRNTFITGPAGTGKTFLLDSIVTHFRAQKLRVVITASTGIAAIMIKGQTLHSFSKLPRLQYGYPDLSNHRERQFWMDVWGKVDVLIIDEISMITPNDFATLVRLWRDLDLLRERVDQVILDADGNQLRRLQLIVLGDFFQLPAVIKQNYVSASAPTSSWSSRGPVCGLKNTQRGTGSVAKTTGGAEGPQFAYCFETPEWKEVIQRNIYLHDVFRQENQAFVRSLNAIRVGAFTAFDIERVQQRWVLHKNYRNDRPVHAHKDEYTWIFATNAEADLHNQEMIDRIKGDAHEYTATFGYAQMRSCGVKRTHDCNYESYDMYASKEDIPANRQFYLTDEKYRKMFHVKEKLKLKIGVRVLLTVNLNTEQGLVNGARGTVVKFAIPHKSPTKDNIILPIVKFDNGVMLHIVLHEWQMIVERTVANDVKAYLWMAQLPLRYAYATTTHQSQGQSLTNVVISLRKVFTFGQGYVALSRARSIEDLHLLDPLQSNMFRVNPIVKRFYETLTSGR